MGDTSSFKFLLKPETFLNNVHTSSELAAQVKNVDGVISLKDLSNLPKKEEPCRIRVELMKQEALKDIIRSVKDSSGREVYAKGKIELGRMSPNLVLSTQTFVQAEKLLNLFLMYKFFTLFDSPGLSKNPSYMISYEGQGASYVAFYIPPIVEHMDKSEFATPLEILRARADKEEKVQLPSVNGNGTIVLKDVIDHVTKNIMKNSKLSSIPVLRDGTHRSSLIRVAGTTIHTITINGSEASATSVPIEPNSIVLTSEKPKLREDRFLGFNDKSWLNLLSVGIDG